MIEGNQGRADASSTMAAIQASVFCSARSWAVGDGAGARADGAGTCACSIFEVQATLAPEVVVEHRLVDVCPRGDAVDAGGVEAALGELLGRGREDGGVGVAGGALFLTN